MASPAVSRPVGDVSEEDLRTSQPTIQTAEEPSSPSHRNLDAAPESRLRLLQLPAELRNAIYRYILVQPDPIDIPNNFANHGYQEPALLTTCKEIRKEAIAIFHMENVFDVEVSDFEIVNVLKWEKIVSAAVGNGDNFKAAQDKTRYVGATDNPNWTNFHRWIKEYHHGNTTLRQPGPCELSGGDERADAYVIAGMFLMLKDMKSKHGQRWRNS